MATWRGERSGGEGEESHQTPTSLNTPSREDHGGADGELGGSGKERGGGWFGDAGLVGDTCYGRDIAWGGRVVSFMEQRARVSREGRGSASLEVKMELDDAKRRLVWAHGVVGNACRGGGVARGRWGGELHGAELFPITITCIFLDFPI